VTEAAWPKVKLAVFDVDGTIIANHGPPVVEPAIIEGFNVARDAGLVVTLATGRTLDYVRAHLAGPLSLVTPVITAQGSVIGDPITGEVLRGTTMARKAAQSALEYLDAQEGLTVLYLLSADGTTRMFERGGTLHPSHDDLFGVPRERVVALAPTLEHATDDPLKIIVEATLDDADAVAELSRTLCGALQIARTHPRLVELTAPGVDKGSGLRALTEILGIGLSEVLAVGDNDNDVPMLNVAGVAVALGDGSPGALAAADWIAPTFADGGAAAALRRAIRTFESG
jgi:Cof subfamily protein (haloacid dehalogenase superfamily)